VIVEPYTPVNYCSAYVYASHFILGVDRAI